jgi:hypothetical protein
MKARLTALAPLACLVAAPSRAHEDRIIQRGADGPLVGRPAARVVARFAASEKVLEPCLASLFVLPKSESMRILAS